MKALVVFLMATMFACTSVFAQDQKVLTVSTSPEVNSETVANEIKNNIRFTAGVKRVDPDLQRKVVAITYDSSRLEAKTIVDALKKLGYDATIVSDKKKGEKPMKVDGKTEASPKKKR